MNPVPTMSHVAPAPVPGGAVNPAVANGQTGRNPLPTTVVGSNPPPTPGGGAARINPMPPMPGVPGVPPGPPPAPVVEPPLRLNPIPGQEAVSTVTVVVSAPAEVVAVNPVEAPAGPTGSAGPVTNPFMKPATSTLDFAYVFRPPFTAHPLLTATQRISGNALPVLPAIVDLRDRLQPDKVVREDACGTVTARLREALYATETKKPASTLSSEYIATRGECLAHNNAYLQGACLADEMLTLMNWGVCPASFEEAKKAAQDVAARPLRATPVQVDFTKQDAIKYALACDYTVAIAFTAYASFETPKEGLLDMPAFDEGVLGGTAALVVGYNDKGWLVSCPGCEDLVMPYGYEALWFEAWTAMGGVA